MPSLLPRSVPYVRPFVAAVCIALLLTTAHAQAQPAATTLPSLAIRCAADHNPAHWGTNVRISATVDNPDHRPLTFAYTVSSGKILGSGPSVTFQWAPKWQMHVEVTCRVTDDLGRTAQQTFTLGSYSDSSGGGGSGSGSGHRAKRPTDSEPDHSDESPPPPPSPSPQPKSPARPPVAAFPWPPPQASSRVLLAAWPRSPQMRLFGDIDARLTAALQPKGYAERSYYSVPGGFALVTRLEQIYSDGRSMPPPARFSARLLPPSRFTDYIRALFTADPGYYRVIVFIVTDQGFSEGAQGPSQGDADKWLR